MRGKLSVSNIFCGEPRITPADAGKTMLFRGAALSSGDHPRGCGENCIVSGASAVVKGSPPRMRGKLESRCTCWHLRRDHPRGCGENCQSDTTTRCGRGSPPRMRGKRRNHVRRQPLGGITPADAGKTSRRGVKCCKMRDHPRGCGENVLRQLLPEKPLGSPPRMRGKRTLPLPLYPLLRITPADAGKT